MPAAGEAMGWIAATGERLITRDVFMSEETAPAFLERPDGTAIAYHRVRPASPAPGPGVIFCGGFKSDMTGTKAVALDAHCRAAGRAFLRFDYFGHGATGGDFEAGTIGRWTDDTVAALDALTEGPQVIVGSSMGGWIMLLAALQRRQRVAGLVGIAPAADFTQRLMWERLPESVRETLRRDGVWRRPSAYDDGPYAITAALIEEGRRHLLLDGEVPLHCPVRILQGMRDPDVPWRHALALVEALAGEDVVLTLVKDGDHRLSRPEDIDRLLRTVDELCRQVAAT